MAERLAQTVEQLSQKIKGGARVDRREFFKLCLILSKVIDLTVAVNQVPFSSKEPLQLIKQILSQRDDHEVRPAVMTVVLSFKGAHRAGWFDESDCAEILGISNTMLEAYNQASNTTPYDSVSVKQVVTDALTRFYPWMRLNDVLFAVQVEAGYTAMVSEFSTSSQMEQMRLFAVRKDRMDSPSCFIVPPVNFLLNGYGVEKRTSITPDTGPQPPADCTKLIRLGSNVVQIVGDFPGPYIIVVGTTSSARMTKKISDLPVASDSHLADGEDLTEGASKISLCCPLSRKRITNPVKGKLCKHVQCFDYSNYLEVNFRRPSWRCPCCHLRVTVSDICIDKRTAEVLSKVGSNVTEVLIARDSWTESAEKGSAEKTTDVIEIDNGTQSDEPISAVSSCPGNELPLPMAAMEVLDLEDQKPDITPTLRLEQQNSSRIELDMNAALPSPGSVADLSQRETIIDHLLNSR